MPIHILTDSTADMSAQTRDQLGIEMLSLKVRFGETEYADGVDISSAEFYNTLRQAKALPITSQVNPGEFLASFEAAGTDDVVVVALASKLSGTYQSAVMAKEQLNKENVYIVDSHTATAGAAILVREAVQMRNAGKSGQEIFDALEQLVPRMNLLLAVDTLTFLVKGGRLSPVAGAMGGLLNIKPVLQIDKEGSLEVVNKMRGFKNSCAWMVEEAKRRGVDSRYPIGLSHGDNRHMCDVFNQEVLRQFPGSTTFIQDLGAVLGTHTGPDCLVIAFIEKE